MGTPRPNGSYPKRGWHFRRIHPIIPNREDYDVYTIIAFPGGRQIDALLLSASPDCLRVVIPGRADTVEFRLIEGQWTSETGGKVELGAILVEESADATRVMDNARGRALSAV